MLEIGNSVLMYRDNLFMKRRIPTVCFAHMGINPHLEILYKKVINKVISNPGSYWSLFLCHKYSGSFYQTEPFENLDKSRLKKR